MFDELWLVIYLHISFELCVVMTTTFLWYALYLFLSFFSTFELQIHFWLLPFFYSEIVAYLLLGEVIDIVVIFYASLVYIGR